MEERNKQQQKHGTDKQNMKQRHDQERQRNNSIKSDGRDNHKNERPIKHIYIYIYIYIHNGLSQQRQNEVKEEIHGRTNNNNT